MVNPIRFVARMQPFDKLRTGFAESGGSGSIPGLHCVSSGLLVWFRLVRLRLVLRNAVVARMQRSGIREERSVALPDCTAFHPGYLFGSGSSGLGWYCAMQL